MYEYVRSLRKKPKLELKLNCSYTVIGVAEDKRHRTDYITRKLIGLHVHSVYVQSVIAFIRTIVKLLYCLYIRPILPCLSKSQIAKCIRKKYTLVLVKFKVIFISLKMSNNRLSVYFARGHKFL